MTKLPLWERPIFRATVLKGLFIGMICSGMQGRGRRDAARSRGRRKVIQETPVKQGWEEAGFLSTNLKNYQVVQKWKLS